MNGCNTENINANLKSLVSIFWVENWETLTGDRVTDTTDKFCAQVGMNYNGEDGDGWEEIHLRFTI